MQLKTIYDNLRPKYKVMIFVIIALTLVALYEFNYPKKYFYSCFGKMYVKTSQIIIDPTEPKESIKRDFISNEDLIVKKYFYGLFYTLNDMKITECYQNALEEINCSDDYQFISFNPYKNIYHEDKTFSDKQKNEKNEYSTSRDGMKCSKDKNSLN